MHGWIFERCNSSARLKIKQTNTPPITLVIIHFQVFLFSISIFLNPDFKYDFLVRVRNK